MPYASAIARRHARGRLEQCRSRTRASGSRKVRNPPEIAPLTDVLGSRKALRLLRYPRPAFPMCREADLEGRAAVRFAGTAKVRNVGHHNISAADRGGPWRPHPIGHEGTVADVTSNGRSSPFPTVRESRRKADQHRDGVVGVQENPGLLSTRCASSIYRRLMPHAVKPTPVLACRSSVSQHCGARIKPTRAARAGLRCYLDPNTKT
jgi:hypothetical protein